MIAASFFRTGQSGSFFSHPKTESSKLLRQFRLGFISHPLVLSLLYSSTLQVNSLGQTWHRILSELAEMGVLMFGDDE